MKAALRRSLTPRKRRIERRLDKTRLGDCRKPVFTAGDIRYEIADRVRGLAYGGIGAMHLLARKIGLVDALDEGPSLFKVHLPYHESDHVLNIACNALCNGTCLQDIELPRNDAVFLDALGARRIPDPTTATAGTKTAASASFSVTTAEPISRSCPIVCPNTSGVNWNGRRSTSPESSRVGVPTTSRTASSANANSKRCG